MQPPNNSAARPVLKRREFLLHEYDALRSQRLKEIEVGYPLVSLVRTLFALVLGLQLTDVSVLPLLMYPAVALALSLGWRHSDARSQEKGLSPETQRARNAVMKLYVLGCISSANTPNLFPPPWTTLLRTTELDEGRRSLIVSSRTFAAPQARREQRQGAHDGHLV